jgi:hypothetical protein
MSEKYPKIIDGEGVEINIKKNELLDFACCDCGLVHTFAFAIEGNGNLGLALQRNLEETENLRLREFGELHSIGGPWRLIKTPTKKEGCTCQSCGRKYGIDLIVPDDMWGKIKPNGKNEGAGLLCGACIMNRIEDIQDYGCIKTTESPIKS